MKSKIKLLVLLIIVLFICTANGCSYSKPSKVGEVGSSSAAPSGQTNSAKPVTTTESSKSDSSEAAASEKSEFYVGDILNAADMEVTFVSSGEYFSDSPYFQPAEGKKYIFLEFFIKNNGKADTSISFYNFECYADGYAADSFYGGEDALSATLSSGRTTSGKVYFEVSANAENIEVEYEYNAFSGKKVKFIYEGNKDSEYVAEDNKTASENAFKVGDIVEAEGLMISYLSCEDYTSENQFVSPKENMKFVSCKFEFENTSTSDKYVSSLIFKCYADGKACDSVYIREDDLSTVTLSSGRKATGTVTFEVPVNATVIEAEYKDNAFTSNHVIFTIKS